LKPRDRFLAALDLEEPDRVPLFEIEINKPILRRVLGREAQSALDTYSVYGLLGLDALNFWDNWLPTKQLGDGRYLDDWGRIWMEKPEEEITFYVEGTVTTSRELDSFSAPDPFDYARLDRLRSVIKNNPKELAIVGGIHDAYEIPSQMRGVTGFLLDLHRNPTFVSRMVELSVRYNTELAKAMIDLGVDAIISGDDYAYKHGPVMSPKHFREFILPGLKVIVEAVHRKGTPFIKHTDGCLWPILEDILAAGIDGLHPIEPQAKMSLAEMKTKFVDRLCLLGNVDVNYILPFGTTSQVEADVRRCIGEAAEGGGYVLSSSNSIHNAVKIENLKTMLKAARKYGVYPVPTWPFQMRSYEASNQDV
jgi:uroporphyrinogen decarboxylase